MGVLIGFHGKLGAGKDEASKQTKSLLENGETITCKAFAHFIKVMTAAGCNTDIATQYSQEGKNKMVPIYDTTNRRILLNLGALAVQMLKFNYFENKKRDDLVEELVRIVYGIFDKKYDPIEGTLFSLSIGSLQQVKHSLCIV